MNLENCRYFRMWESDATPDSMQKNCCRLITDGEDDRNSQIISVDYSSVAVLIAYYQGQAA